MASRIQVIHLVYMFLFFIFIFSILVFIYIFKPFSKLLIWLDVEDKPVLKALVSLDDLGILPTLYYAHDGCTCPYVCLVLVEYRVL